MGLAQSVGLLLSDDSPSRLILKINASELLAVVIAHDEARFLFFDRPRRREAASVTHLSELSETKSIVI